MSAWQLEVLRSSFALLLLLVTWFLGQRVILFWDRRKKRQELDIAATERFQHLYGELKEVSRLWRSARMPRGDAALPPATLQWELLARATSAESAFETLVIKLSTERILSPADIRTLGVFRQAVQDVRESIRRGEIVPASGFGAAYLAFNDLAAQVACLIGSEPRFETVAPNDAMRHLEEIALTRARDWQALVQEYEKNRLPRFEIDRSTAPRQESIAVLTP